LLVVVAAVAILVVALVGFYITLVLLDPLELITP
jgi:hypothetical protein